jgi:hypothetical protein
VCDLSSLRPIFDFAADELRRLGDRHLPRYELSRLRAALESGEISV